MTTFPALNHVAVTVRDIAVSGPWYQDLVGAEPLLDEHTDAGFRHLGLPNGTLFGIHQHDRAADDQPFTEFNVGLDHVGFGCADHVACERDLGSANWRNSASPTAASSTLTTDPDSVSGTPTG